VQTLAALVYAASEPSPPRPRAELTVGGFEEDSRK